MIELLQSPNIVHISALSALISPINIPRIVVELIIAPDVLKQLFCISLHLIPLPKWHSTSNLNVFECF